ncbi:MAG: NAD-dependent epimerase/dehydratase family protein [Verrucomicrobiae bacterium]|nr:NAD-dependent epimerase/dehydratase family protein [Verrucomicrobiae bacterium]
MSPSRILVTGAAGFIGSHTVDELLASGLDVTGIDDLSTGRMANLSQALSHPRFSFVRGDVTEPGKVEGLCERFRPGAIIHLAGLVSVTRAQSEPDLNFRLNLLATHLVAEAARKHGVRRLVFASSAAVYGDQAELPIREEAPVSPVGMYGTAKLASEKLLLGYAASYDFEAVCLRYFNVFGPRQDPASPYSGVISIFADRLSAKLPVTVYGDGSQTRDFVSVRDLARANRLAATAPSIPGGGAVCNVCTGKRRAIAELTEILRGFFPRSPYAQFAESRPGEILHSCGDPDRAEEVLGFRAGVDLEEGLRELVTYVADSTPRASA